MRYTIDLTDSEWTLISYCFPKPSKTGRPRQHPYRELLNAIFYLVRTGCQWRNLPKDFAPWRTVYHYFRCWKRKGLWNQIHTHLREHHYPAGITPLPICFSSRKRQFTSLWNLIGDPTFAARMGQPP